MTPGPCLRPGFLAAVVASLLFAGCSPSLPTRPEQLTYPPLEFKIPEVEQVVLPNGIRLYLREDNELPLVQVTAMVGAGGITTPQEKTGFPELYGAAWRAGGTHGWSPEALEEELDLLAANLSASMGTYVSQVGLSIRSEDLERGIGLVTEMLRHPTFAAEQLELERLKLLERVRRQNDQPGAIAKRQLMAALYPDHPLGFSPTMESVAAVERQDMLAFHREHYAPNNLWLAISGDFDRSRLLQMLDEQLGDWKRREVVPQSVPELHRPTSGALKVVIKDIPQTSLLLGDIGLTKDNPKQYAVQLLNFILGGGGFNSRMMREIRSDRGLAYSAYSYFQVGRRLPGPFVAGTETKNATAVEALQLIRQIMTDLRDKPVSAEELQLAQESRINSFVFGFDDTHAIVTQRMRLDFFGYPADYLSRYRDRIAAVTATEVLEAAREFLRPERQQIVLVGQAAEFDGDLGSLGLPVDKIRAEELDQ